QRLNYYPPDDLRIIVERSAEILDVRCTPEGAAEISKRSRGTPRVANRLLRRVRDYAQVRADGVITREVADEALQMLDVDEYGLDGMDSRVVQALSEHFEGAPGRAHTAAVAGGEGGGA